MKSNESESQTEARSKSKKEKKAFGHIREIMSYAVGKTLENNSSKSVH